MMSLNIGLLIIVALYIFHIYNSSAKQTQTLEQDVKTLRDKMDGLEKVDKGKESPLEERNGDALKVDVPHLRGKISQLEAEVKRLENLVKGHKEQGREDKLCLIEGMKRMLRFLGHDQLLEGIMEEVLVVGSGDGLAQPVGTMPSGLRKVEEGQTG
jgi:hypothetical protein